MSTSDALIRPPQQRRSREALERILRAGAELLQEAGFEGFTLQEVSRRAEVSIGSIYARAPSKDALILAIHEREMERLSREAEGLWLQATHASLGPREFVEALVRQAADIMLGNASVLRVFMLRAAVDREISERGSKRSHDLGCAFQHALLQHRHHFAHPEPELAADIAYRVVYSTLARRLTHGSSFESARVVRDEVFVRELGRAVADYVLGSALKRGETHV